MSRSMGENSESWKWFEKETLTMDSTQNDEPQETPTNPTGQPQVEREVDLREEEGVTPSVPPERSTDVHEGHSGMPAEDAYDQPLPVDRLPLEGGMGEPDTWVRSEPALADPGIYVCIKENAGEHGLLGRLDYEKEYDYSQEANTDTLAAIAACVESGLLEKK
jgi:hypothetical protein